MPTQSRTSCASDWLLLHVVQVVGADQRQADLRRQAEELLEQPPLLGQAVVLDLEEEVARAEDVAVVAGQAARQVPVLDLQRARDLAVEAGRQADQPLACWARYSRSMRGL